MDPEIVNTLGELERKLAELERTLRAIDRSGIEDLGGAAVETSAGGGASRLVDESAAHVSVPSEDDRAAAQRRAQDTFARGSLETSRQNLSPHAAPGPTAPAP